MASGDGERASEVLRFLHEGRTIEVPAEEVGLDTSLHTGRALRRLRSEIQLAPEEAALLR